MKHLADNIRKANEEAGQVEISSHRITEQSVKIERVELDHPVTLPPLNDEPEND